MGAHQLTEAEIPGKTQQHLPALQDLKAAAQVSFELTAVLASEGQQHTQLFFLYFFSPIHVIFARMPMTPISEMRERRL